MQIVTAIEEVRSAVSTARAQGKRIGFVPTMGFLHRGHLSLLDVLRNGGAGFIVVSIFVNPRQFAPTEDFQRYPRDEERDRALLSEKGTDVLFLPPVEEMYPTGATTSISVGAVALPLEGSRRPGHFEGVATVCAKLFNIVQPDLAAFGRKDAQQCAVIERMVTDLDFPLRLLFGETQREEDGLALSSRNSYLSPEQREIAPVLYRALRAGEEALRHNVVDVGAVERLMHQIAGETPGVEIDYLVLIDPLTFARPEDFDRDLMVAGAVRVGSTRLIDNIRVPREAIPRTTIAREAAPGVFDA